jgi:hypothetical protein
LFENWVVSEVLKGRVHRGHRGAGYFVRDRKGFEIDHLIDIGSSMIASEIKSGRTVAGDFFAQLERLPKVLPSLHADRDFESRLIYGGTERQKRRAIDVIPWNQIKDLTWW